MIWIRHLFLYAWILCAFILHWRLVWRLLHQEVHYLNIPVEYKDQHGATVVRSEPWPIIDVHETMHYLVGVGKILVPHSERLKYWRNSRANGEEWAQDTGSELMVPIGLYGDSAKVTTRFGSENVLAMFCNVVLWRPSSVRWSRFLIFAIPEERLTSPALLAFLRRIAWSCNHAFSGKFPVLGVQGEQLTGEARRKAGLPLTPANDRFQVTEYRGDWGWHKSCGDFGGLSGTLRMSATYAVPRAFRTTREKYTGTLRITTISSLISHHSSRTACLPGTFVAWSWNAWSGVIVSLLSGCGKDPSIYSS